MNFRESFSLDVIYAYTFFNWRWEMLKVVNYSSIAGAFLLKELRINGELVQHLVFYNLN